MDGMVWGLNPSLLQIPELVPNNVPFGDILNGKPPLFPLTDNVWIYLPPLNFSDRLRDQMGCFTVQGKAMMELPDALTEVSHVVRFQGIRKVRIRREMKSAILCSLKNHYRITFESLFPDLTGLARDITQEYERE